MTPGIQSKKKEKEERHNLGEYFNVLLLNDRYSWPGVTSLVVLEPSYYSSNNSLETCSTMAKTKRLVIDFRQLIVNKHKNGYDKISKALSATKSTVPFHNKESQDGWRFVKFPEF